MSRKPRKNHPKMLASVLQAISDMKDTRGCSVKRIVEKVNAYQLSDPSSKSKPRNVTVQVRRALRHGLETGLLLLRSGKYKLGLKDKKKEPVDHIAKGRNRKYNNKRKRRPSVSSVSATETDCSQGSDSEQSYATDYTEDEERPKSRTNTARKRKKRDNKRAESVAKSVSRKKLKPHYQEPDKGYTECYETQPQTECDNPDCLCNIKQEQDEAPDKNHSEEDMNRDGYIN